MSTNPHQAAHAAVGYLYQSQWPLLELIRRAPNVPDAALSLELQDDVVFDNSGTPVELLQVKHHLNAPGGLGDMDVDLWKTMGVWMDAHPAGDPGGPLLGLVSTGLAAEGTAAAALRPGPQRDTGAQELARQRLDKAATDSGNTTTAPFRQRYLNLSACGAPSRTKMRLTKTSRFAPRYEAGDEDAPRGLTYDRF